MYTIKQAAARTGLNVPTIRAWERRYGVVHPNRTAAGYRLYDEDAIARLAAMRRLVEHDGWRPSQAAQRVLDPDVDLAAVGRAAPAARSPEDANDESASVAVAAFVDAARRLDIAGVQLVLDEAFARWRFERAMAEVVFPALRSIGDGWMAETIDVAMEHAASETVRRRLARFYDAAGRDHDHPSVVVGLPPGSHHEIGAFAFAVAARRAGLDVLYLGASVPLESWLRTARETHARAVVIGVVTADDIPAATLVVDALGTLPHPPARFIGGSLADELGTVGDAIRLDDDLEAAVGTVEAVMAPHG